MLCGLWKQADDTAHRRGPRASRSRRLRGIAFGTASAALMASCSDSGGPSSVPCADDQQVAVSVSAGPRPTFTWAPACGMTSVQVFPSAGPPAAWVLYGGANAADNPLRSGILYGEPPAGTVEAAPEAALQAGTEYEATVYRWIGAPGGPGGPFPRGSARFTP